MRLTFILLVSTLSACGAIGVYDGDFRHLGVIEQKSTISRAGEPSKLLMAFGAIGGAIYGHTANSTYPTNLYTVKTTEGESVSAQTDDEFAIGDCVEVIPSREAGRARAYVYGSSRMVRSEQCKSIHAP